MADNDFPQNGNGSMKSQWDDMGKEDLIKQVKKQLLLLKKLKAKCDEYNTINKKIEEDLSSKNTENFKLKTYVEQLELESSSLKTSLVKLESDNAHYNTRIKALEEQLECTNLKEESANAAFICMKDELKNMQIQIEDLTNTNGILKEISKANEIELKQNFETYIECQEKRLDSTEKSYLALQDLNNQLKFDNESLKASLMELKNQTDSTEKNYLELQDLNNQLKFDNESLKASLMELKNQEDELNQVVRTLESDLFQSKQNVLGLSSFVDKTTIENQRLLSECSNQKLKLDEFENQQKNIQTILISLSTSCGISFNSENIEEVLNTYMQHCVNNRDLSSAQQNTFHFSEKVLEVENFHESLIEQVKNSVDHLKVLDLKITTLEKYNSQHSILSEADQSLINQEMEWALCNLNKEKLDIATQVNLWKDYGVAVGIQTTELLKVDAFTETELDANQLNTEKRTTTYMQTEIITVNESETQTDPTMQAEIIAVNENETQTDATMQTEVVAANETVLIETNADLSSMEKRMEDLNCRAKESTELVGRYKNVALKAKREIAELKKKLNDMQSELQVAIGERNTYHTQLEGYSIQLTAATKDKLSVENAIKSLQTQLNLEKEKHRTTSTKLEQALKEANKSNLISLEIADYEKLVCELNKQLDNKDLVRNTLQVEFDAQKQAMKALEIEIEQLEVQNKQSDDRAEQLKVFNTKLKSDIAALRDEERDWKTREDMFSVQQEASSQEIENYKLQLSELINEMNGFRETNRVLQDSNEKILRSSENRIGTLSNELQMVKEYYSNCQNEYENYKVRVHSVLKQQKKVPIANSDDDKIENTIEENVRLGKFSETLQSRVQELTAQLSATNNELESIQEEHQNVLQRYNHLLSKVSEQESSWKQRFESLQKELQNEQQELNHLRQMEKHHQLTWTISAKQQIDSLEKIHNEKIDEMHTKFELAQDEISRLQREIIECRNIGFSVVKDEDVVDNLVNTERQEGEGSESIDYVFSPTNTHGSTNLSHLNSSFVPLEQLLTQDEKSSVESANSLKFEKLENQLAFGMKKIDHLTEILNESEATNARMAEQTRVLKEEIRRLERNQEREQHLANLEYTKNVIIKFLSLPKCDEKERLIPVLTTLLRLSPDEERQMHQVALGTIDVNNPSNVSGWSSYLPRWPGGQ